MKKFFTVTLLFVALIGSAQGQVRKCTGPDGKVTYSDMGCSANSNKSAINLSGANITEEQARSSQERMSTNAAVGGEVCPMLKERAQQALARYQETKNINSSNASLQSLQNLGNYCPYSETCDLIKSRVTYAQQRHNEEGNKNTAAGLDASLGLLAKYCQKNAAGQPKVNTQATTGELQTHHFDAPKAPSFYTNDEFGTMVKSDKCFMTKDTFGTSRRSAGCARCKGSTNPRLLNQV